MREFHPLTELIPTRADQSALEFSIAQSGLTLPVVVYEGMVLEGRVRYRACLAELPSSVQFRDWVLLTDRDDPVDWMVRTHIEQHDPDELDRIRLVASVLPYYRVLKGQTEPMVTAATGLSNRKVRTIGWLLEAGKIDTVLSGEMELLEAGRAFGIVSERKSIALGKSFGSGDKFDEAFQPIKRYLAAWKRKGYEFRHLNPREASRRLLLIDQLIEELQAAREDLAKRSKSATLSAPPERSKK